ncbi:tRNA (adenosine(37)-N6)-threonylcarbamoyltransferase complex dimerization subunit type 1 TsaB [Sphingomonas astaxanthinifaciens]|uniref:tRNA (Adenosine(37)-N6)-threonylcarbamoyltransferase complex dimerization subunit type 1 TsaB n=1 Tax=Sphingomonas astaxanthinifaciens DSM 22298 TaxID=1123267 RepID=A0ABQ5Z7V3_9SPHN|nr:tRNA (adenosine(37)-N6)-threonylcarbamoyltransferase complex dimerization subunit type 1 TsaB [Sphingomonas astaxanthinifaciens]GLR47622.1 tRNA (adenosine(37)-N6)-threonylcarbamoyltransferase complex dimerization subunit type 1 TsaB [Sphingomonas astaxanthinifaciens DSM 22298]
MLLVLDTATPACTAALLDEDGTLVWHFHEVMNRGHAERLMPLLDAMLDGRRATSVLVGCGPGSFTGLRVGIAAAHGLALGWGASLSGMSTLALLAASVPGDDPVGVALTGGHGELFVQQFSRAPFAAMGPVASLVPAEAARKIDAQTVAGSGAAALVAARGAGEALDILPDAAAALRLPQALRTLAPKPIYARAPDAKPKAA